MSDSRVPWPVAVSFLIRPLQESFSLADVYALADPLRSAFPQNNNIEAKIRQSLQVLRERGRITFDGRGRYTKCVAEVRPSVHIDFAETARYTSRSQIARVAVEVWAATNVSCYRCESPLLLVPPNTRLLDAVCRTNQHEIQVKAVAGVSSDRLTAAAHGPLAKRLEEGSLPDYLIISYDRLRETVILAEFVDGRAVDVSRLRARSPLRGSAKRAGWVGATIDLTGLMRSVVVGPSFQPEQTQWSSASTL